PDIVCALRASPALFSAPITPGTDLTVKWWMAGQPFPDAHWGPIIDYIAPCNGPCASISKTALQFVKIAEWGWIDNSTYAEGFWATNEMIAANGTWPIRIPAGLSPGEYVVRHELIALHVAFEAIGHGPYFTDGAEFYPQCVTIVVGGTGTKIVEGGIGAMELYRGDEPGLAINIHTSPNHPDYVIPGPPV
ncbi:glycoside hydrolase, partial [Lojkania enalia]